MAKNGVFKKITALAMAIALVVCFAVSASAVSVATTTQYVDGNDIRVNVTVTGVSENANVTYYAKKGDADVHIDQTKASGTTATFQFDTAATNLDSTVKVGYTGASEAENADITGYTVTHPNGSVVIPTEALTVTISYTPTPGKVFDEVTVTDGTATIASAVPGEGNTVTVTFGAKLAGDVTLAVTEKVVKDAPTATAEVIDAAAIVSTGKVDGVIVDDKTVVDEDVVAEKGNRKLTVIGKVGAAQAYGIVVSEGVAITSGAVTAAEFEAMTSYAGATKDDATGVFAIQLIDTSAEDSGEAFVKKGVDYYTAVYALDANGDYIITANAETVRAN